MNTFMRSVKKTLAGLAVTLSIVLGMAMATPSAMAADKIELKDGRIIDGEIIREMEGILWVRFTVAGIQQEQMFTPQEIKSVERDAKASAAPVGSAPVATPGTEPAARPPARPGVPRAVVITLGDGRNGKDMVGLYMTEYQLQQILPMLEEELGTDGRGIVVFRITSGGGLTLEVPKLNKIIHEEYKKRFRTVAWIDSAISAAAMTAHVLEEIYFTPQGNYGAASMFSGRLVASRGWSLEVVLQQMEKVSELGGYNPLIMRAMQVDQPLSATVDSNGVVHWFPDATSGEIVVNRPKEILTLNAVTAERVRFSRGTAATIEELGKLMGYQEIEWVGERVANVPWPVSKAEKWTWTYRDRVKNDEDRSQEYIQSYNMQMQAAAATPREERGKFVNRARQSFEKMKAMVRNNPNFAIMSFNVMPDEFWSDFVPAREKELRDIMR